MKWYSASLICPKDNAPCILRITAYSADGEIHFGFQCPICNENFVWQIFATSLAHQALIQDLEARRTDRKLNRAVNNEISRIVRPPMKPEVFTQQDLDELKAFHIKDEEEK